MSVIDPHTADPAKSHPSENMGHEMSDFTWTTVMWLVPISVVTLIAFVLVSLYWFRGAKDSELSDKQAQVDLSQLSLLRAKENEVLTSYKWIDKEKGRVQIPIERAMELVVKEHENIPGAPYRPITDTYLQGAAFSEPMMQQAGGPAQPKSEIPKAPAGAVKKTEKKSK
jgi:hypothetical protein